MTMKPRDRVLAALDHREPDRVPIVIGISNATSLKMNTYRRLKDHLEIKAPDEYLYHWPELGTARLDDLTLERLGGDVRGVLDREPAAVRARNHSRPPGSPRFDSWGIGQVQLAEGEWYPGIHPLQHAVTSEELEDHTWPNMDDPSRVAHVHDQARRLAEEGRYAVMGIPWLLFPLERACGLQGMDTFLLNLAVRPEFARSVLEKNLQLCKRLMGHFLREAGEYLDLIKIGDDLGTQESLLISPEMYREFLKPVHAELIAYIKDRTAARVFFHTDGDVYPLISDLIEIGVDVLNPVQTSAGQMADLEQLKRKFGRDLVFCGGIDTHHYLPHGTPAEVEREVRRVIGILGPGGGYLASAVHTIMNDVPPENILAMVDAVKKHGTYPL